MRVENADGTLSTEVSATTCVHFRFRPPPIPSLYGTLAATGSPDAVEAAAAVVRQVFLTNEVSLQLPDTDMTLSPISINSSLPDLTEFGDEYDYDDVEALYAQQGYVPNALPNLPASALVIQPFVIATSEPSIINAIVIPATAESVPAATESVPAAAESVVAAAETVPTPTGEHPYAYLTFGYDIACRFPPTYTDIATNSAAVAPSALAPIASTSTLTIPAVVATSVAPVAGQRFYCVTVGLQVGVFMDWYVVMAIYSQ